MRAHSNAGAFLANLLLVCAIVEFACLRVLIRSGPAPRASAQSEVADLVVVIGHTAMNLGGVVALLLLALQGRALLARGGAAWQASGAMVVLLVATMAVALLGGSMSPGLLVLTSGISAAAIILIVAGFGMMTRHTIALMLFGSVYVVLFAYLVVQVLSGQGTLPTSALPAYYAAEALVVFAATGALLLAPRPWSGTALAAGAGAGLLLLMAHAAIPWLVATMAVWVFGVTMSLPTLAYGVALACFVAAALQLRAPARPAFTALLLMALGGMKLDVVYFNLLGLAGFLMLACWTADRYMPLAVMSRRDARQSIAAMAQPRSGA